jgi:BlaI family penicillinase repressor
MLRRMTEKGLIKCDGSGEVRLYSPLVAREDAAMRETGDFINRVYKGSVGLMMSAMTEKQMLTKDEIDELYAILKKAEEDGNA